MAAARWAATTSVASRQEGLGRIRRGWEALDVLTMGLQAGSGRRRAADAAASGLAGAWGRGAGGSVALCAVSVRLGFASTILARTYRINRLSYRLRRHRASDVTVNHRG